MPMQIAQEKIGVSGMKTGKKNDLQTLFNNSPSTSS